MKAELIRNSNNQVVGYKLIKEPTDDLETFERMRDMHFWGVDEEVITYNGRVSDKETDTTVELKFATKAHAKKERDLINSSPLI